MLKYDYYNREERAICAHLFRLLHERLVDKSESPLGQFINRLSKSNLLFKNGSTPLTNLQFNNVAIFCEVAAVRDAYQNAKSNVYPLMDDLTRLIMRQENVGDCRIYSELPNSLNNIHKTHPKQIKQKADFKRIKLSDEERQVYGAMQAMFNAKPDLVITIDNILLVCEAKFTESFDNEQLDRTWKIAEVWATLLYEDFGFSEPPIYTVFKLGKDEANPDISWADIAEIALKTYSDHDRTRIALEAGVDLLNRKSKK